MNVIYIFCNILLWAGVLMLVAGMILLIVNIVMSFQNRHKKRYSKICLILLLSGFVLVIVSGILYGFLGS